MNVNIDYMVRRLSITEQDTPKINPLSSGKAGGINGSSACPERSRRVEPFTSLAGEAGFGLFKPFPRQNKKHHMGQSLGEGRGLDAAALTATNLMGTLV